MTLILASSSPFRKDLLNRLGLPFECLSPEIDESRLADESAEQLVQRLAQQKAEAVAAQAPHSLVIGSDQVAVHNGRILGKPGTRDNAVKQLTAVSGQTVHFYTGLCLLNTNSGDKQCDLDKVVVHFRHLTEAQIHHYIDKDDPLQCAGSFRCEGLGISLFQSIESQDPCSLIGLPLIRLTNMLSNEGVDVLTA